MSSLRDSASFSCLTQGLRPGLTYVAALRLDCGGFYCAVFPGNSPLFNSTNQT